MVTVEPVRALFICSKKMPIETLKRIMWRLRENKQPGGWYSLKEIHIAIHEEAGIDRRTEDKYVKLLVDKELFRRIDRWYFEDTQKVV